MGKSAIDKAKDLAVERFLNSQPKTMSVEQMVAHIAKGDQHVLAKAITLVESTQIAHKKLATQVVNECLPLSGNSIRIGITGVPGVGKSTFIEALGMHLTQQGLKTAVLAIDPSSNLNKGSILGDKTRMENLSVDPLAFVRPSPSSGTLGGVANATRESILLCEAAGYQVIIVETVGVGQSEYLVKEMVDFFLLLMLSGAGDEIQGIKRGIMEMADALFVNKADGDNKLYAQKAARAYANALHLFPARDDEWIPETGICSAIKSENIDTIWEVVRKFEKQQKENKQFYERRKKQSKTWLLEQVQYSLKELFFQNPNVEQNMEQITKNVVSGAITPYSGSQELMDLFLAK
tara:strand:- start:32280 stop:33326 length:1047 start_codon:yes stop_codon:yes gene_type:complete